MFHDPKTTAMVGGGGFLYTLANFPWAGIVGFLSAVYLIIQIIGGLPKAIDTVRSWFK
ncbi:hypothetical protein ACJBUE_20965 (plasmid) [Ralstonia syzygii subsp. celebesensis]|uniref:Transmembrane protein n=1 Tax=blood disease bacterium R229 TaxID=741978 RepID=G2ZW08_9RALS|nr:hypothetical protein [Ralstonia syzygii]QQV57863.1 hypothetical protein JK151_20795 [Ralstonia syzygii subsp. celebesensis]CCA83291.1 hypothetical protein BDB_mp60457 [blood disease bacterium R229]